MPKDPAHRRTWLSEQFARSDPSPQPNSLERRLGLFDATKQLRSGVECNALLVALASIDRVSHPLMVDGVSIGTLVLAKPEHPADGLAVAFLLNEQRQVLIVFLMSVVLSAMAAALLAANFRRPIGQLAQAARALEAGHYETRLSLNRGDELGELSRIFDNLAERLEQTEAARRQWVAATSHELRTPLAVLRAQLEALQDGVRTASPEQLAMMVRHVEALGRLVDQLYELARAEVGQLTIEKTQVDLWPLLSELFASFESRFAEAGLVARLGPAPSRSVALCDAARMREIFTNLFENCARYTDRGGTVEVTADASSPPRELRVIIDDSAPGVPEATLARLGERFFRASSSQTRGMGLGLALAKLLLEAQGGSLRFSTSPLGGLRVTVGVPV